MMSPRTQFVVDFIRRNGPATIPTVAQALHIGRNAAGEAVRAARCSRLLAVVGKAERRTLIFGAVQTANWPVQP